MFFSGFFCGFERCGSLRLCSVRAAAFPNFRGGNSSPPQAAKAVRANSRILHHVGNCKFVYDATHFWIPRVHEEYFDLVTIA